MVEENKCEESVEEEDDNSVELTTYNQSITDPLPDLAGRALTEIMATITNSNQKDYLYLRLKGYTVTRATSTINLDKQRPYQWRHKYRYFAKVDDYLSQHRKDYEGQATNWFLKQMQSKCHIIVRNLIDKGVINWDGLTKEDKAHVKWAIGLVWHIASKEADESGSYDELVLRARRNMP